MVTGTSVVGLKYKGTYLHHKYRSCCALFLFCISQQLLSLDGVLIAADTLGSYGSSAMFTNLERIIEIGEHTIIGGGGEYSDFQ